MKKVLISTLSSLPLVVACSEGPKPDSSLTSNPAGNTGAGTGSSTGAPTGTATGEATGSGGTPAAGIGGTTSSGVGGSTNAPGSGGTNGTGGATGEIVIEKRTVCTDGCTKGHANNGECNDNGTPAIHGGVESGASRHCWLGTDCSDCGPREVELPIVSGGGRSACSDQPFGDRIGDYAENWTTYNQHGVAVSLSDFCGKWVVLSLGRMNCGPCNTKAKELEEWANELGNFREGLVTIQALGEGTMTNVSPPQETLQIWTEEHGQVLTHAVADMDYTIFGRYWFVGPDIQVTARSHGHPQALLIDPEGKIANMSDEMSTFGKFGIERRMEEW